jgi:predicted helicase
VNFIVRAVDDILKTEFDMPQGLADTSKTKIKVNVQGKQVEQEVHKVQILDPATGTGTFLAEVVKHIHKKFQGQQGIWSNYVETHLLPRLNGFELLMASYAMAHLKLDLLLKETGYQPTAKFPSSGGVSEGRGGQRLRVYLTNSLEESHPDTGTLFANWLSAEANEANHIKRDTPVMCVIGNPPYASSSSNNSEWIQALISDYKKNLNEKKSNINDDYIKFLRFGQYFIEKNGSGILAFITNNSFLDGNTTREMRKNLLNTFDKIYVLDLHGDVKKKLSFRDENVFDIQQGVSINIFVKKSNKNVACEFNYSELHGKRLDKYNYLQENAIKTIKWEKPILNKYYAFFNSVGNNSIVNYEKGIALTEIFREYNSGIQTKNDELLIQDKRQNIEILIDDIKSQDITYLKEMFKISE